MQMQLRQPAPPPQSSGLNCCGGKESSPSGVDTSGYGQDYAYATVGAPAFGYDPLDPKGEDTEILVCCGKRLCPTANQLPKHCGWMCCGACLVFFVLFQALVAFVAWENVKITRKNAQEPHITPFDFPRFHECAGCPPGYKTDAQLQQCMEPCVVGQFSLDWETLAKDLGYKLVFFPSRNGPRGEPPVNISAWWLPPPEREGYDPSEQPRIVLLHGMGANNNHCGVQSTCFLLRQMGFGCLTPSVRDYGLSGASTHPQILSWAYDYPMDLLGAWDYAVNDPDGVMGGATTPDKVGIGGFSKGALGAAIAFAIEPKVPGAWLDSGPYSGLYGMMTTVIGAVLPKLITPLFAGNVWWWAHTISGDHVGYYEVYPMLEKCSGPPRSIAVAQGWFDNTVPPEEVRRMMELINGLPSCFKPTQYTPPSYCNAATHHVEMWEFPDDTRSIQCDFWTEAFSLPKEYCQLSSLPKYQQWDPPNRVPPGTPELSVI